MTIGGSTVEVKMSKHTVSGHRRSRSGERRGERINYGHVMISVSQLERVAAAGGIASSCIFEMSLILETSSSV